MTYPRSLTLLLLIVVAALPARADVKSAVAAVLKDPYLGKATTGVVVARLNGSAEPQVVFSRNADRPLIPASNLKLITSAAALDRLGADFKFKTRLLLKGRDLYLIGDGDPTLGDSELLKQAGWEVTTAFEMWADVLKERGITSIDNLYIDDSVFDEEFLHPNWPMDQAHKRYVPQVAGLNLNANCLDFFLTVGRSGSTVSYMTNPATAYANIENSCKSGNDNAVWLSRQLGGNEIILRGETNASNVEPISVTIHDPAMYAGTVLLETLKKKGIAASGTVQRDRAAYQRFQDEGTDQGWTTLLVHETPLSTVLARCNKDSMNLYAEALCKRLGHEMTGAPGSWANGTAALGAFLQDCGVSAEQFALDDGSGLSRNDTISAGAIVRVLSRMFADPDNRTYLASLAISGQDGTLKTRFTSDLEGRVIGKSGYINRVSSLSGFFRADDGNWYVFSILMNDVPAGTNPRAKQLQEKIVQAVNQNLAVVAAE